MTSVAAQLFTSKNLIAIGDWSFGPIRGTPEKLLFLNKSFDCFPRFINSFAYPFVSVTQCPAYFTMRSIRIQSELSHHTNMIR